MDTVGYFLLSYPVWFLGQGNHCPNAAVYTEGTQINLSPPVK